MNQIEVGDVVDVYFENVPNEFGMTVLYIPQATGDSWILRRPDGTIVEVQMFSKMVCDTAKEE